MSPSDADGGPEVDVLVAGGGLSGLGAALALARAHRSVLLIDAGRPRNAPAAHSHGYLTRDGVSPPELLRLGRLEVRAYGGVIIEGEVTSLKRSAAGDFCAELSDGTSHRARRVLVATGLVDELPDVPGLRERWGRDVVHCPSCFGWEFGDEPLGVLGTGPWAAGQALMWRQWSGDLLLFAHTAPDLTSEQREQLFARGIGVVTGEVIAIETHNDRLTGLRLATGQVIGRRAVVISPKFVARHTLLDPLGVQVVEHPLGIGYQVNADPTGLAAPGVYVAGNLTDVTAGIMQAAASGVTTAAAINADLTAEDTAHAVIARKLTR